MLCHENTDGKKRIWETPRRRRCDCMHVSKCRHCREGAFEITGRLTYKISLSRLYKEQIAHIKEFDTILNSRKVAQNIKKTVKDLEKMQRSRIDIETTRIRLKALPMSLSTKYKTAPIKS